MKQVIVFMLVMTLSNFALADDGDREQRADKRHHSDREHRAGKRDRADREHHASRGHRGAKGCKGKAGRYNPSCPTVDLSCEITQTGFFVKIVHLVVSNTGMNTATNIAVKGDNGYSSVIDAIEPGTSYKEEVHPGAVSYLVSSQQRDTNAANDSCNI